MVTTRSANPTGPRAALPKAKDTSQLPKANTSRKRTKSEDDKKAPAAKKSRVAPKKPAPPKRTQPAKKKSPPRTKKAQPAVKPANGKAAKSANTSRKRKSDDNDTDLAPPPSKRARAVQKRPAASKMSEATRKASASTKKKQAPKPRAPRVAKPAPVKPKVIINHAPTQRLDVYAFGEGSNGELGLGSAKNAIDVKRPRLNPMLSAKDVGVVHIAVGGMHCAALTHDNKILTWGVNDGGALGRDTTWTGGLRDIDEDKSDDSEDSDSGMNPLESTPTAIPASSFPEGTKFVQLSAGDSHTLALTDEGLVYSWGSFRKKDGPLGHRPTEDKVHYLPKRSAELLTARKVKKPLTEEEIEQAKIECTPSLLPELQNITQVASGANHALALDKAGNVFAWGAGEDNQFGWKTNSRLGTSDKGPKENLRPQPARWVVKGYKAVYAGPDHNFAIDTKDRVWAWGLNSKGGCGVREGAGSDEGLVTTPEQVKGLDFADDSIVHISGGQHHSIAVSKNGKGLIWGTIDNSAQGLDVSTLAEDHIIRDDNDKPRINIVPTLIPNIGKVTWAAAGTGHTIAINEDGKAFTWGIGATYQTGLGNDEDVEMPTLIDNSAVREKKLSWSGCGGQFSLMAAPAVVEPSLDED